jgi:hypothetical protein
MADLASLVQQMNIAGAFTRIVNNPMSQLGPPTRRYIGAELLPEKPVPENLYSEQAIQYRTVIANDTGRYSPVQLKSGMITGSMLVQLGEIDTGSEMTAGDYDAVIKLIRDTQGQQGVPGGGINVPTMQAMSMMTNWAEMTLNQPLVVKQEKQRWEAIVNAQVTRTGDNGFQEVVSFPNPTGHRVNAAGTWSDPTYDPYADIMAGAEFLAAKGYTVGRIITSTTVRSKLSLNPKVTARIGRLGVVAGAVVNQPRGRATLADLNEYISGDGLPPIELYDLQYRTQSGSAFFLPRNVFVMVATTGRDTSIDRADLEPLPIQNTLGYQAVGRPAGQESPGKKVLVTPKENKPPRLEGEAWGTTFPVILEPEAIFVIKSIS